MQRQPRIERAARDIRAGDYGLAQKPQGKSRRASGETDAAGGERPGGSRRRLVQAAASAATMPGSKSAGAPPESMSQKTKNPNPRRAARIAPRAAVRRGRAWLMRIPDSGVRHDAPLAAAARLRQCLPPRSPVAAELTVTAGSLTRNQAT